MQPTNLHMNLCFRNVSNLLDLEYFSLKILCPFQMYRHGASQVSTKKRDLAIFWWDRQYFLLDYQAKSRMVGRCMCIRKQSVLRFVWSQSVFAPLTAEPPGGQYQGCQCSECETGGRATGETGPAPEKERRGLLPSSEGEITSVVRKPVVIIKSL